MRTYTDDCDVRSQRGDVRLSDTKIEHWHSAMLTKLTRLVLWPNKGWKHDSGRDSAAVGAIPFGAAESGTRQLLMISLGFSRSGGGVLRGDLWKQKVIMFVNPTSAALTWRRSWNQKKDMPFPNKWALKKVLECACTCCACTASDDSAALAGARVASASRSPCRCAASLSEPSQASWLARTRRNDAKLKCYAAPCFISLCCFSPFMSFVDNGEALAPKVLGDFFFFFNFPLLWRQRIDFYPDFYPAYSIFTLQAFWPTNTRAFAQKCPFVFPLGTFLYYYYF